jgi:hypothetical protein
MGSTFSTKILQACFEGNIIGCMKEDFSELLECLDGRFNGIEKKFNTLPEIFVTKDEAVTKNNFEDLRADFRDLQKSVDGYAIKADKFFQDLR